MVNDFKPLKYARIVERGTTLFVRSRIGDPFVMFTQHSNGRIERFSCKYDEGELDVQSGAVVLAEFDRPTENDLLLQQLAMAAGFLYRSAGNAVRVARRHEDAGAWYVEDAMSQVRHVRDGALHDALAMFGRVGNSTIVPLYVKPIVKPGVLSEGWGGVCDDRR